MIMKINSLLIAAGVLLASSSLAQQSASATFGGQSQQQAQIDFKPIDTAPKKSPPAGKKKEEKKARDPLSIHADAAVKNTNPREIVLPGVMRINGENAHALDFTKARSIQLTNGGSETVYLSAKYPNRIQLPFADAKIIGAEGITVKPSKTSNNIYIQFDEGFSNQIQVYFENKTGSKAVLGLMLVPKDIPGQTLLVQDNTTLDGESIVAPKTNDYISNTQYLFEVIALGGVPQGFSRTDLDIPPIIMSGLVVKPRKLYSTSDRDIYEYDVTNPNSKKAIISEQEFDGDSVLAVSIFPKPILEKNEQTRVIVVARKRKGS